MELQSPERKRRAQLTAPGAPGCSGFIHTGPGESGAVKNPGRGAAKRRWEYSLGWSRNGGTLGNGPKTGEP